MPDLQQSRDLLEFLYYVVVLLGVPTGLYQYFRAQQKEQAAREERVYDALHAEYLEFQKLCLQYPYLDVSDQPDAEPVALNPQQRKEEGILFSILFGIFERAYILHLESPTRVTRGQWRGWETYIRQYCGRDNVRRAWTIGEDTYDPRFNAYMNDLITKLAGAAPPASALPIAETKALS
ncbi:MAG: hypothetical protein AB7R89_09055 [Dehalococcoidia bacterium]